MNAILTSIDKLEDFAENKKAEDVLTEVFNYPNLNVLKAYQIKLSNKLQLDDSLTVEEKTRIARYSIAFENLIKSKHPETSVDFNSFIDGMFNSNIDKTAMHEIEPKIVIGDHYCVGYDENGRLITSVPMPYLELIKHDSYTLDAKYNFNELKNIMKSQVINIANICDESKGDRRKTFEMVYKIQSIREEVLNQLIPFAKKLNGKIMRVLIRYDRNGKSNLADSDYELTVNKTVTEDEEQYTAIIKFV
jgi:hypothetical protein